MSKLPWFKFYPKDWMGDSGLQMCSWETKGIFIEMICIMAESNRYGFLEINDKKVTQEMLKKRLRIHHKTLKTCLRELQENNVLSIESDVYFSRKMVKQAAQSLRGQELGKLGGNPSLLNKGLTPPLTHEVKSPLKLDKELDKDKERKEIKEKIASAPLPFSSEDFKEIWQCWINYRKEIRKPLKPSMINQQFKTFVEWGEAYAIESMKNSIKNGWTGLFFPKDDVASIKSDAKKEKFEKQMDQKDQEYFGQVKEFLDLFKNPDLSENGLLRISDMHRILSKAQDLEALKALTIEDSQLLEKAIKFGDKTRKEFLENLKNRKKVVA
jgi:hypothetical protein